jgi:hypothetical protein
VLIAWCCQVRGISCFELTVRKCFFDKVDLQLSAKKPNNIECYKHSEFIGTSRRLAPADAFFIHPL